MTNRINTKVISTKQKSSQTTTGRSKPSSANGRKTSRKTTKNNTPLIIGGVVGFFLLMIIIVAIASNKGNTNQVASGDQFMTSSLKQEIYHEYLATCKKIEQDAQSGLANLSPEDRRRASSMTYKKVENLQLAAINKLQGKWQKQIPNLPENYIQQYVIDFGKSNGW